MKILKITVLDPNGKAYVQLEMPVHINPEWLLNNPDAFKVRVEYTDGKS